MIQRDLVLRWIQTLSALIARLLRREPGVTVELAQAYLEDAKSMMLGSLVQLLPHLDPSQVATLLNDPHRIFGYAQLLGLESALERAAGNPVAADQLARRSVALGREGLQRIDQKPEEWEEWLAAAEDEPDGVVE